MRVAIVTVNSSGVFQDTVGEWFGAVTDPASLGYCRVEVDGFRYLPQGVWIAVMLDAIGVKGSPFLAVPNGYEGNVFSVEFCAQPV